MKCLMLLMLVTLAGCGGGDDGGSSPTPSPSLDLMNPQAWEIGPIIDGKNYSLNMPLHPAKHPEGWVIDIPQPTAAAGHVHYITTRFGSLAGRTRIRLTYRVEADPGVKIVPVKSPASPSIIALYFQRRGDDWSGKGKYETYRWYASFNMVSPVVPGSFVLSAALDQNWTAIETSSRATAPAAFDAAVQDADRVGFVLGGGDGIGHGVFATGPVRIVVTGFEVQ